MKYSTYLIKGCKTLAFNNLISWQGINHMSHMHLCTALWSISWELQNIYLPFNWACRHCKGVKGVAHEYRIFIGSLMFCKLSGCIIWCAGERGECAGCMQGAGWLQLYAAIYGSVGTVSCSMYCVPLYWCMPCAYLISCTNRHLEGCRRVYR